MSQPGVPTKPSIESFKSFEIIDMDEQKTPGILICFNDGACLTATIEEARRLYGIKC